MILAGALAVGVLVAAGIYLVLKRDVIKMAAGTILLSDGAILFLVAAGFGRRAEAIAPLAAPEELADPVAQALALTAIVIGLGTTAFVLTVCLGVEKTHGTIDVEDLVKAEREDESRASEDEP